MNLLTEKWIPVRPLHGGAPERVSLAEVHCTDTPWLLCLPRDDMELAALQLLICLTQISWIPEDDTALRRYLSQPMSQGDFDKGIGQWGEMFRLDHPTAPALQVKGVSAKEATGMDKLLAGLTGATNCAFVNEPGQGAMLCGGCAAIALLTKPIMPRALVAALKVACVAAHPLPPWCRPLMPAGPTFAPPYG